MKLPSPQTALVWLGFARPDHDRDHAHGHPHTHGHGGRDGHTHGVVDPTIATSDRGIWAIKWSFVILAITAALQFAVVILSGSVALLADTIHNIGDAVTAVPLWIAFRLARRKPSQHFTYGLGRVEDLAGVAIVGIILSSAIVAGWEAVNRLIHPQPITLLWAVAAAGAVGFLGNELCAIYRIRVGREIDSAALIAGLPRAHGRADESGGRRRGRRRVARLSACRPHHRAVYHHHDFCACSTALSRISSQISDMQRAMFRRCRRFSAYAPAGSGID
jgi:cation efflux family protein